MKNSNGTVTPANRNKFLKSREGERNVEVIASSERISEANNIIKEFNEKQLKYMEKPNRIREFKIESSEGGISGRRKRIKSVKKFYSIDNKAN